MRHAGNSHPLTTKRNQSKFSAPEDSVDPSLHFFRATYSQSLSSDFVGNWYWGVYADHREFRSLRGRREGLGNTDHHGPSVGMKHLPHMFAVASLPHLVRAWPKCWYARNYVRVCSMH